MRIEAIALSGDLGGMRIIEFIVRGIMAWAVGFFFYMIAMMMTTYDGIISIIFQPIVGSVFTTFAVAIVVIPGSPLFIASVWQWWQENWWISVIIILAAFLSLCLSWCPFRVIVIDPVYNAPVETFQPSMAVSGWLGMMFGILYCPVLSIQWLVERLRVLAGTDKEK